MNAFKSASIRNLPAARVAVVIPCYRVEEHIVEVIRSLPSFVSTIVVVDDKSPDQFVDKVLALNDPRVVLIRHEINQGVGGAMITGYRECLRRGEDVIVKVDGDGQMDPAHLPALIRPLLLGEGDYTKGNRWHDNRGLIAMPAVPVWAIPVCRSWPRPRRVTGGSSTRATATRRFALPLCQPAA